MISRAGPVSKEISAFKDVEDSLSDDKPSVVAFIKSSSDPLMKTFMTLAKSMIDNAVFLHSHNNIYENSGENELRLYLPKRLRTKLEPDFSIYSGEMEVDDIKKWIRKDGHGLVGYRSPDDSFYFVDSNLVVIYNNESINTYPSGVKYLRNRILKTLKNHPDKFKDLKFAYSFTGDFSYELSDYEINADQLPAVRISSKDGKKYRLDKYSPESFLEFLNKFQNGLLTPHLKSEPIPTSDSSVVKKLVALNFNDIVNDEEKDVMVVFHAPWCGHCKNLMPKYEEAASKLKNEPNLVLAAMDATANDVPPPYEVTGFPTIYFVPKGKKSSPMLYQGGRDTSDIIKFLAREATEELSGYDRSGNTKKSDL
nr:unknown [Schistosoma japonicum]